MYYNGIHSYIFLLPFLLAFTSHALASQASNHHTTTTSQHSSLRFLAQCPAGTYRVDSTCSRVCPRKHYGFQSTCLACTKTCDNGSCISEQECNPCKDGKMYVYETKTCVSACTTGYFEDYENKICVKCAEGCPACSFPTGSCDALKSNSLTDSNLIIYIAVPLGVLILAVVGVIWWRKTRKPKKKKSSRRERDQANQDQEAQSKKNKLAQLKRFTGNNGPVGPYNVMPEDFNQATEDNENEEAASPGGRSIKKRPTIPIREFKVDDSNDEHAITHGSAQFKRTGSLILSSRGGESPAIRASRKPTKKMSKVLRDQGRQETLEARPLDLGDESGLGQTSYGEVPSSPAAHHYITPKKSLSAGFMTLKKMDRTEKTEKIEKTETLESPKGEEREKKDEILQEKVVGSLEEVEDAVVEVEKIEEAEEMEEDDCEKRERGYREDSSMNMSTTSNREGGDFSTCTICGLNKKDCINRPCGHIVGCYACMKLFRESYGVCPKCKLPMGRLERVKKDRTSPVHKEVVHLEILGQTVKVHDY